MGSSISHWTRFTLPPSMHRGSGLLCTEEVQINWKRLIKQESGGEERHALESLILHAFYHLIDGTVPKAMAGQVIRC